MDILDEVEVPKLVYSNLIITAKYKRIACVVSTHDVYIRA